MASSGYSEYKDVAAVIFNHIRSSLTGFKPSLMIPWLEPTDDHDVSKSWEDERKVNLINAVLERMVMDDIISEMQTSPGLSNMKKKLTISPRLNRDELLFWEYYASTRGQQYQWARLVFKTRSPNPAMNDTLASIERYLKETRGSYRPFALAKDDTPNAALNLTKDTSINLHRTSSVGSDTTTGSTPDAMPSSTQNSKPPPTNLLSNPLKGEQTHTSPPHQNSGPDNNATIYSNPPEATISPAAARVLTPGFQPINAAISKQSLTVQPVQESSPLVNTSLPAEPPPIPTFLSAGLARLRERLPDDEFEATLEGDIWLIKCFDCEQGNLRSFPYHQKMQGIYRPNYQQKDVNNFETHLKNQKHTENVADKLARLGKEPTMTADVRARMSKFEFHKNTFNKQNPVSFDMPRFPTERQFKALSARETAVLPAGAKPTNDFVVEEPRPGPQSPADPDSSSLLVTLGPCESLKRPSLSRPESTESVERVKRRRLSQELLEKIQIKNEGLAAQVEKLELINENSKKRDEDMATRVHNLGAFNQTLYDNTEVSRKRIDGLEISVKATAQDLDRLTQSTWSSNSKRDGQIEELKRSIAAVSRSSAEVGNSQIEELKRSIAALPRSSTEVDNSQNERVMSKALEMEETYKQLQEKCTSYEQRLDTAAQAEQEMRDRLMMVQKLALRQAEAMKEVNREKEETEKRFAQLEEMIKSQAVEKNGWNESFRTVIDRTTEEILNCQTESNIILARVEQLENERDGPRATLRTPNAREDGSTRISTRRSGGRRT